MSRCPCNRCSSLVLAAPVPAARSSRKAPRPVPGSTNRPGLAKPSALRNSSSLPAPSPGLPGAPGGYSREPASRSRIQRLGRRLPRCERSCRRQVASRSLEAVNSLAAKAVESNVEADPSPRTSAAGDHPRGHAKVIRARWWRVPHDAVPRSADHEAQVQWLYDCGSRSTRGSRRTVPAARWRRRLRWFRRTRPRNRSGSNPRAILRHGFAGGCARCGLLSHMTIEDVEHFRISCGIKFAGPVRATSQHRGQIGDPQGLRMVIATLRKVDIMRSVRNEAKFSGVNQHRLQRKPHPERAWCESTRQYQDFREQNHARSARTAQREHRRMIHHNR